MSGASVAGGGIYWSLAGRETLISIATVEE